MLGSFEGKHVAEGRLGGFRCKIPDSDPGRPPAVRNVVVFVVSPWKIGPVLPDSNPVEGPSRPPPGGSSTFV